MRAFSLKTPSTERLIFWSVALLLFSQLAWWLGLQIRESRRLQEARIATMRAGRAEAWQMDSMAVLRSGPPREAPKYGVVEARVPQFKTPEERRQAIEERFPYVAVVPAPVEVDDPMLLDDQPMYLTLRQDVLKQLERERTLALYQTAGQAAMFVLAVLLGMTYIYRKLNTEMELMLRQRNFIAAVTHELKTPIASLRVWIETLFDREIAPARKPHIRKLMDGDLLRLTELVGNLLEVARVDAGILDHHPESVEMAPWLKGVCEAMDHRLGQGQLGLRLELNPKAQANIDPKNFATVIENLLSNAFKYASEPRETTVTLDSDGNDTLIVVADRGHGISPKELPRLFQRFYRAGDEMTRQVPGTGLGLFLCREIVQRHHGEIRASSLGAGMGTTFTIRIPGATVG